MNRSAAWSGWTRGGVLLVSACGQDSCGTQQGQRSITSITRATSLEINGFNYTDLYMDGFTVNGQGGGNIFVSSPTSGGAGACAG